MRLDLHVHSRYSRDSLLHERVIVRAALERGLGGVAITDHNTVEGGLAVKALAPAELTVIVGEEINTRDGEIIGLFLRETVPAGLTVRETVAAIREQGGLVVIPHPCDRIRRSTLKPPALREVLALADAVEVFNSRTVFARYNREAARIASRLSLPGTAGSDAHLAVELGAAWVEVPPFSNAQDFLAKLKVATWQGRRAPLWGHIATKAVRRGWSLFCRRTD